MRAASYMAFAVFSASIVATPGTAPNATGSNASWAGAQDRAVINAARSVASDPSAKVQPRRESRAADRSAQGLSVGETLPEAVALHFIPKHETYRYAVVNDRRVIVDASSRKVVYVIR
jgi:hypothetical protein